MRLGRSWTSSGCLLGASWTHLLDVLRWLSHASWLSWKSPAFQNVPWTSQRGPSGIGLPYFPLAPLLFFGFSPWRPKNMVSAKTQLARLNCLTSEAHKLWATSRKKKTYMMRHAYTTCRKMNVYMFAIVVCDIRTCDHMWMRAMSSFSDHQMHMYFRILTYSRIVASSLTRVIIHSHSILSCDCCL